MLFRSKDSCRLKHPAYLLHGLNVSVLSKHAGLSSVVPGPLLMVLERTASPSPLKVLCAPSRLSAILTSEGDDLESRKKLGLLTPFQLGSHVTITASYFSQPHIIPTAWPLLLTQLTNRQIRSQLLFSIHIANRFAYPFIKLYDSRSSW